MRPKFSNVSSFSDIQKFEPLSREQWELIKNVFTPTEAIVAGLNFVDHRYGVGVINEYTKCVWTRECRRVTMGFKDGTRWATLSKIKDPACPKREK